MKGTRVLSTMKLAGWLLACALAGPAQVTPGDAGPLTVDLADALARARKIGPEIRSAELNTALAQQDVKQARVAKLPTASILNQFLYTQGNGTQSGVFVTNNGVHVYTEQAQIHEEIFMLARHGELRAALSAQAVAQAKREIAARGLTGTVVQNYYAVVVAQRHLENARISLGEADRFLDITQKQEKGGEVAHVDTVKAQLQSQQRQRDLSDAIVNVEKAKIALAVLIFPQIRDDFNVKDDLAATPLLAPMPEVQAAATSTSPDLKAASESLRLASEVVTVAKYGYFPSFTFDLFYGLNSNQFSAKFYDQPYAGGPVESHGNLGYAAQFSLNIPVWNWGTIKSKVTQADIRRQQAELDVSLARRTLNATLETAYREARAAQEQLASLRSSLDLSNENLRLTLLRYQAGESTAFEVVDAQNTLAAARNALSDGLTRYRQAVAIVQTLTGAL